MHGLARDAIALFFTTLTILTSLHLGAAQARNQELMVHVTIQENGKTCARSTNTNNDEVCTIEGPSYWLHNIDLNNRQNTTDEMLTMQTAIKACEAQALKLAQGHNALHRTWLYMPDKTIVKVVNNKDK